MNEFFVTIVHFIWYFSFFSNIFDKILQKFFLLKVIRTQENVLIFDDHNIWASTLSLNGTTLNNSWNHVDRIKKNKFIIFKLVDIDNT